MCIKTIICILGWVYAISGCNLRPIILLYATLWRPANFEQSTTFEHLRAGLKPEIDSTRNANPSKINFLKKSYRTPPHKTHFHFFATARKPNVEKNGRVFSPTLLKQQRLLNDFHQIIERS